MKDDELDMTDDELEMKDDELAMNPVALRCKDCRAPLLSASKCKARPRSSLKWRTSGNSVRADATWKHSLQPRHWFLPRPKTATSCT
jgi:hypothetical protein